MAGRQGLRAELALEAPTATTFIRSGPPCLRTTLATGGGLLLPLGGFSFPAMAVRFLLGYILAALSSVSLSLTAWRLATSLAAAASFAFAAEFFASRVAASAFSAAVRSSAFALGRASSTRMTAEFSAFPPPPCGLSRPPPQRLWPP